MFLLQTAAAVPANTPGSGIRRPPAGAGSSRIRRYHSMYQFRQGRFFRNDRPYIYYGGRYFPDRRVFVNGKLVYMNRHYTFVPESGRYFFEGRYYYYDYTTGHLIHDTRIFRRGRYYHRGVWYVYRDGRYFRDGRYYFYANGEYYPEDEVPEMEIEELSNEIEEIRDPGNNPPVAGAIYYVCKKQENNGWVYFYRAYNPSDIMVGGPYTLAAAKEKIQQFNAAVSGGR